MYKRQDQHGDTIITVTVEDGGLDKDLSTSADNGTISRTFNVTVQERDKWHNNRLPEDVNKDGQVSPVDALFVINHLNVHGAHELPPSKPKDAFCLDVNDDQWVSPSDAIRVINYLNVSDYYVAIGVETHDGNGNVVGDFEVAVILLGIQLVQKFQILENNYFGLMQKKSISQWTKVSNFIQNKVPQLLLHYIQSLNTLEFKFYALFDIYIEN